MKRLLDRLSIIIASVFFVGFIPFASGTFGSITAVIFVWFLKPDSLLLGLLAVVVFCAGTLTAHVVESIFGKDSSCIVIDEFDGYLVSVFALPLTPGYLIAGFFLFRFFDILKPPPIRNIERAVPGGLGVMLDDVAAGLAANAVLHVWRLVA